MVYNQKHIILVAVLMLFGAGIDSENSDDSSKSQKQITADNLNKENFVEKPAQNSPKILLDTRAKDHGFQDSAQNMPESALLAAIAAKESKLDSFNTKEEKKEIAPLPVEVFTSNYTTVVPENSELDMNPSPKPEPTASSTLMTVTTVSSTVPNVSAVAVEVGKPESFDLGGAKDWFVSQIWGNITTTTTQKAEKIEVEKPKAPAIVLKPVVKCEKPAKENVLFSVSQAKNESSNSNGFSRTHASFLCIIINFLMTVIQAENFKFKYLVQVLAF